MTTLKKNPVIVAAVLAAAAIAAYWFLVLTPKQEEAAQLQQQITAKQAELDTAKASVATYQRAKAAYKSNYAAVTRLGKAVPADTDVQSLMVQIDAAAGAAEVDFDAINVGAGNGAAGAATSTGFTPSPVNFSFEGTYFSLSDFLDRVDRFVSVSDSRIDVTGRLLNVDTVQLSLGGDGFPRISAKVAGNAYVLAEGQDVTSGATAAAPAGADAAAVPAADSGAAPTPTATVTGVIR